MRHASLKLSPFIFLEFCKGDVDKIKVVGNKLPDDTTYVHAGHDNFGFLYLVLESKEFADLKDGDLIPELPDVQFEKL